MLVAGVAALHVLGPFKLQAQTWKYVSIYTGTTWSNPAAWSGGVAPINNGTANVVFSDTDTSGIAFLDANWNVASVYFNTSPGLRAGPGDPTIDLSGGASAALTVQQGGITNVSPSAVVIKPSLIAAQPQTWNTGTNALSVYNVSGPGAITKTGAGRLVFLGSQYTFTGGINVDAGTLVSYKGNSDFGPDTNTITLRNGGVLNLTSATTYSTPATIAFNHPLVIGSGGGGITTFNANTTFNAPVSGAGSLTLNLDAVRGPYGPSAFNFTAANTYAGGTVVGPNVSAIVTGGERALGTGDVTVQSGGALFLASAGNLATGKLVVLQDTTANQAAGALILNDASLSPAALVSAASTGGVVGPGNLAYTTPLDFSQIGNGKIALGSGASGSVYAATSLLPGSDGVYRLGGGAVGGTLTIDGADNVLTGARSVVVGQNGGYTSSSLSTGSNNGNGVVLARPNNYTGGTTLLSGVLGLGANTPLGTGTLTLLGGSLRADGGTRTIPNPVSLKYGGLSVANHLTFTGPVDLNGTAATLNATGPYGPGVFTFANTISNGALTLVSGTYYFTAANTFSGGLTVSGAKVFITADSNLGAASSPLILGGGTLAVAGGSSITINRSISVSNSYSAIATGGALVTVNGQLAGSGSLTKSEAGKLVLTGSSNTCPVTVVGGVLQVDNSSSIDPKTGNSIQPNPIQVTANYGGTLAGTGLVGYTSAYSNGHIAPGDNGAGTLKVSSGLSLGNGAVLDFDLGPNAADAIVLSNTHSFQMFASQTPVVLNVTATGGLAPGQTYKLIDFSTVTDVYGVTANSFQLGASPVGGTFSVANNAVFFTTAAYTPFQQWQSSYFGSINNASAAPTANPSGDGINNLLKYALGLDPRIPTPSGLPEVGTTTDALILTYSRPGSVGDVTYLPQYSDDLLSWSNTGVTQETVSDDGKTQTIRAKVAFGETGHRFIRLLVSR